MKLRPRRERDHHSRAQEFGASRLQTEAMQSNANGRHCATGSGNGASSAQGAYAARLSGEGSCQRGGDVRIQLSCAPGDSEESPGAKHHHHHQLSQPGSASCSHAHSHSDTRRPQDSGAALEDQSTSSLSEFRYFLQWLHKSLPYILILSVKLLMQHITGRVQDLVKRTAFIMIKEKQQERCSKLQCAWILVFLTGSSLLLYYTFYAQSLHYSLILLSPSLDFMNFWEVLWIVGITDFILKFLFMSFKCIILLLPCFIMSFKSKGYWYMLLEELCQYYRRVVPVPVWFRYFVGLRELNSMLGWSLGILLALLYLILKLLSLFGHLKNFRRVLRVFYTRPSYGVAASKRQCAEADDLCSICQAEFQKPLLLICQVLLHLALLAEKNIQRL
ncbi:E3 ubiquitin-protein ligase RNFT1 [Varanus komodoensis]|nr:E3 ubiquitin-protein ligase RNFT1 [Varanus komodoensis]